MRKRIQELVPDVWDDKDPEFSEEQNGSEEAQLLTDWDIREAYKDMDWFQELETLGKHWNPNTPGHNMQIGTALTWTYVGIRVMCAKKLDRSNDADSLINKMMDLLEEDIKKYDPGRSSLGSRMSSQIKKRFHDANRILNPNPDHDAHLHRLRQLEYTLSDNLWLPEDSENHGHWADAVIRELFSHYRSRVDSVLKDPEKRAAAKAQLREKLLQFDPGQTSLQKFAGAWVETVLNGERATPYTISLDLPTGEDGEGTLEELTPGRERSPAEILEDREGELLPLLALVVNFLTLKNQNPRPRRLQHYQLFYTEQLTFCASLTQLPDSYARDFLNALEENYFRYFTYSDYIDRITLRAIEQAELRSEGELIPGRDMVPLRWNPEGFLPSKVQIGYLRKQGIEVADSTISEYRKDYQEALHSLRETYR